MANTKPNRTLCSGVLQKGGVRDVGLGGVGGEAERVTESGSEFDLKEAATLCMRVEQNKTK